MYQSLNPTLKPGVFVLLLNFSPFLKNVYQARKKSQFNLYFIWIDFVYFKCFVMTFSTTKFIKNYMDSNEV